MKSLFIGADDAFIAEVPELPGCMADGKTYQETVANTETVIEEWLEAAKELGRPIPAPRGPANVCLTTASRDTLSEVKCFEQCAHAGSKG